MEESIYSIIPKQIQAIVKPPLYRSKYSHAILPTGSTFNLHNTKISRASNLSGDINPNPFLLGQEFALSKTLGMPDIKKTINPKSFLKKQSKKSTILLMGDKSLQSLESNINAIDINKKNSPKKFKYNDQNRKPSVPKHNQKCLLKCKSSKDFIATNTVEMILSSPKNVPKQQKNWLKKQEFGKIPQYLINIKNALQLQKQKQQIYNQNLQQQNKKESIMTEQQVNQIRQGLKQKYIETNHQYQGITHKAVNSLNLKIKKERLEKELKQIQDDIKLLNNKYIVVRA